MSTTAKPDIPLDLSGYSPDRRRILEEAVDVMSGVLRWDRDAICRDLGGRSWSTVTRFLGGKPQGDIDGVIADFARLVARHAGGAHIRTPVTEDFERVLGNARADGRMGLIVARNGRGKTITCTDWIRRHPRARATYVHTPSGCTRPELVILLCSAAGIDPNAHTQPARERAVFERFTARDMLVIDEAGNLITSHRSTSPIRLLQDIHDLCRCPVVLVMRPAQWSRFEAGRSLHDDEQFIGRILHRSIVHSPYKSDEVRAILDYYHPGAAVSKSLRRAIRDELDSETGGLRALCADLQLAAEFIRDDSGVTFEQAFRTAAARRRTSPAIARLEDF